MKILSLSLDKSINDPNSKTSARISRFNEFVEKYTTIVPSKNSNKVFELFKICKLAKSILKNEKYDLITVQDQYYLAYVATILAKKFSLPLEIQIHGFEKYSGLRKILARRNIAKANGVRVVSARLKREIIASFGVNPEVITVVPIFTDLKPIICPPKSKDDTFTFLTVSRLVPVKSIGLQIETFKEISEKYPNTKLIIVGDGPLKKDLQNLAKKQGISANVDFVGWQENVSDWYCRADAFLLTSKSEGWGLAVIDATLHSLPVIMTDVGCAGEVIINTQSGIVVPVGGKIELFKAMESLITSKQLCEKLGNAGRLSALKLPSFEETMKLYVEGFNKAIKSH